MNYQDQSIQQQIEAYLRQEMTDLERAGFERRMHEDNELHEEVHRQEAIIEAIRRERMLVLKSGLQNVGVSLWSSTLLEMAKIAAVSVGLGFAAAGGYWYFQQEKSVKPEMVREKSTPAQADSRLPAEPESSYSGIKSEPHQETAEAQPEQPLLRSDVKSAGDEHSASSRARNSGSSNTIIKESLVLPETDAQEPSLKAGQPETPRDFGLPEDGLTNKTRPESLQPEVVIKRDNKEKFHYQFSDGKLVLYADFSNKLYEVLELNQYGDRQLYLAYDGKFFALNPQVSEISPLKEVRDKNLVQILCDYQKRK